MENQCDPYASGMIASDEADLNSTTRYDQYQYNLFKSFLNKGPYLEVGAGAGRVTDFVIEDSNEDMVVSEPSPHFFNILKKRYAGNLRIKLEKSTTDELRLKYGQNFFGSIYSVHVMEHVENDLNFLNESLEMLKPGGRVIILVPALQALFSDLDRSIGHFRRYDKRMIKQLLTQLPATTNVRLESLFYSNFIGVFASFYFLKIKRMTYQGGEQKKSKFIRLYSIYSKYFVPMIEFFESYIPLPFGLNLTVVLSKQN